MKLAVIGDTQHYRDSQGRLCALEPVVNQLDRWAQLFDEVVMNAPLDAGPPPPGFAPYSALNVTIEPLPRAGGNTLAAKLALIRFVIPWALKIRRVARSVDAVHIRCPCNIGLVAIFATRGAVQFRYAMYAGVWRGYDGEPFFFGLQRRLLASPRFGGPVSVYAGRDPKRPHLEPFFSPSYSQEFWQTAANSAQTKLKRLNTNPADATWRLVTVGRLTVNKNQASAIRAVALLRGRGVEAHLEVLGDGPERSRLESLAYDLGVDGHIEFRGNVDHPEVMEAFALSDLHLLTTRQEGYGKVLLEGMVYGTVPIFGDSPVADDVSGGGTRGVVVDPDSPVEIADAVGSLVADRDRWVSMAQQARSYARSVSLDAFAERTREMLTSHWGER